MSGTQGDLLKRNEIFFIRRAGITSFAENADRIAEVMSRISWPPPWSSDPLIGFGRSHLSCRRIQLHFSAAKTLPARRKTLHGAASYSLVESKQDFARPICSFSSHVWICTDRRYFLTPVFVFWIRNKLWANSGSSSRNAIRRGFVYVDRFWSWCFVLYLKGFRATSEPWVKTRWRDGRNCEKH